MPITLTVSEGVLSADAEVQTFAALTQALLSVAQLEGNAFMTPNVIGTLNVIPATRVFSAGKPAAAAFVELTLPQIALATPEAKQAFTEKATTILEQAAGGRLTRDRIWTNIVYAADGSWGIAGRAHSNADLVDAIQEAAIE
ncbi:tautomerase family protein [Paraburkholderia bannensis]|uniref:tautomerase family protein n=1 Tax=Paraburkholderia bannensis TaxID=765414 RepID=UPI002AB648A0|nr:Tautomerase enzyme [Paraburkholderia bannensis]